MSRSSGTVDSIKLLISEKLCENPVDLEGKTVKINGLYRSYNKRVEGSTHNKLELNIFVNDFEVVDEEEEFTDSNNQISLSGYICKAPIFRPTPLGREICDLLIAVNRAYGKSDYIPCIAWGRNAKFASNLSVGDKIKLSGRIQSRTYIKNEEEKVVYEVSISSLSKEDKDEKEE